MSATGNYAKFREPDGYEITFIECQEDFFGDHYWIPENYDGGRVYWDLDDVIPFYESVNVTLDLVSVTIDGVERQVIPL